MDRGWGRFILCNKRLGLPESGLTLLSRFFDYLLIRSDIKPKNPNGATIRQQTPVNFLRLNPEQEPVYLQTLSMCLLHKRSGSPWIG